MSFISPQQNLDLLCQDNINCSIKGCKLKHPRILAGVCIDNLRNICNDTKNCNGLQHLGVQRLKQEFNNPPINGIYLFNICKSDNCQNSQCRFVHPLWKNLICWTCLNIDVDEICEQHSDESHNMQWLRENIYDKYNMQECNPENLCMCNIGCKKKSHQLKMSDYCLHYFKGICPLILCNKQHVKWEEFQQKVVQQNNRNQVIKPCIKQENKQQFIKQQQTYSINIFQPKTLQDAFNTAISEENVIDIIFILDCTSSMQKWIDKAKGSISRIMQEFKTKIPFQSRVRIAVVCFRDFDCGNKRIAYHNFTTHAHLIEEFIGKQLAEGGEDIPEDLLGALEAAYSLNISTKELSLLNLVIMTDAPCHGKPYHDLMWDEYSENQEGKLEQILEKFKKLKQRLFVTFFHLLNKEKDNKVTQKMENIMKTVLLDQFFTATIGESQFADYVKFSLQTSLQQKARQEAQNFKSFSVVCEKQKKMEFTYDKTNRQQNYIQMFQSQLAQTQIFTDTELQIELKKLNLGPKELGTSCDIFKAFDTKKNTYVVLKIPKNIVAGAQNEDDIIKAEQQALFRYRQQLIAQQLIFLFNSKTQHHPDLKQKIDPYFYTSPCLYRFDEKIYGLKVVYGETFINIENQTWTKYSSNYNYADQSELIVAFSHFTFDTTNNDLIITDLQGKKNLLSDPAIHTLKKEDFLTCESNFEQRGVQAFFQAQHPQCNQVCFALNLNQYEHQQDLDESTSYIPQHLINSQIKTQYFEEDNFVFLICSNCGKQEDEFKTNSGDLCTKCRQQANNEEVYEECECCKNPYLQNYNLEQLLATVKKYCSSCKSSKCNKSTNPKCYYCNETICLVNEHEHKVAEVKKSFCIEAVSYLNSLRCSKCNKSYGFQKLLSHEDFSTGKFECC